MSGHKRDLDGPHNPIGDLLTLSGVFFVGRWVDLRTERRKKHGNIWNNGLYFWAWCSW
jgi:hypothetical protein